MFKKFLGIMTVVIFAIGMLIVSIPELLCRRMLNALKRADEDVRSHTERRWQAVWARRYWWLIKAIMGMEMTPKFLGPPQTTGGPYIYLLNHRCVLDHFLGQMVIDAQFVHDSFWVIKEAMARAPGMGRSMATAGYALVKRGGQDPEGDIERICEMARRAKLIGASVVIYAEGTRYDYLERSLRGQRSDFDPHLANPRTAGFNALCSELPDYRVKVVCLDWAGMEGGRTLWDGRAFVGLHGSVHVWEEENPGADGAANFLHAMWQRMHDTMSGKDGLSLRVVSNTGA
ncbi:MAG: 1-acyl-sn-glycerol-3-phosphate acyltransferase [Parcubacteria group bacterium]|nr:1-acyl-sn-glycerol-3-phosphate acyltransferase [Parcubacteria group bacterium]